MKQKHHKNVQIMFSYKFKWHFGCIINTKILFCKGGYIILYNYYSRNICIRKNYCDWICIYDLLSALFTFLKYIDGPLGY
jgi:hypothetical protein